MKKNIAMRVAAFLFILTMISTCAFATTFAKYTTSGSTTDTARVAKWGVTITATAEASSNDLFVDQYENSGVVTVKGSEAVVAPGTSGTMSEFSIAGTPEVMVDVIATADLSLTGWVVDGNPYCPIVITVGTNPYAFQEAGHTGESIAEFEARVEAAIVAELTKNDVAPNNPLADSVVVSWAWAFHTSDANDVLDTKLGATAATGTAPRITLTVSCTVVQVD